MTLAVKDRVRETTTTTGTGTVTLAGAVAGFQSFSVIGDGNTTYYTITNNVDWEVGIGTYTSSGTTLSRDTILESSNGGTAVNFGAGTKDVFVTYPAEKSISDGYGLLPVTNGGTGTNTAFTAGSVVFAGTSGVYTQDNANLFWDDTNNRLGIGTATPAYQVDVYSTSAAALTLRGDAGATLVLDRAGANANAGAFTSRKMRGTLAVPSAVASGDFSLNLSAQVYGGSNFRSSVAVRGNVETYTSDTDISSYLTFWTVPAGGTTLTERVRITGAGDVGIGTSSPSYKLDVNGTARASNAILSSIPTSDPSVTGQLWNSGGVAAVSGSTPGLWDFWTEVQASGFSMAPWTVASISSGTSTGTAVPAATMKGYNPFGALVRSSTTANSGVRFWTVSFPVYFGVSAQKFRAQLTPATAFANNTIRVGFLDTTTSADATDGAYFEMDGSGVVSAKTAAAGTRTTSGTTYTLTINTPYTFDIEANAAGTSIRFRIYAGTSATAVYDQSITTNIPTTTGNATGSGIVATNSGTTASDICVVHSLAQGTPTGFNRVRG